MPGDDYLFSICHPVEQLRASMAISTRTESSGANAYTLARMLVPTGEMPIEARFAAIAEAAESARLSSATANLDTVATVNTDMIDVDPTVHADVDLNQLAFADRAAAVEFILNPSASWRARVDLFDTPSQPYPNIILYNWQQPAAGLFDLNPLHFADKAAAVRIAVGPVLPIRTPLPTAAGTLSEIPGNATLA